MGATANVGAPPAAIPFASLPASQPLTLAASTAGAGVIDDYAWTLISRPPGSAAALSSTTVVNPTLNTIDQPGTYYLAGNVHDSIDGWAWNPDPASGALQNLPNTMPSALICINVSSQYATLVPYALGERTTPDLTTADAGYMNAWGKTVRLFSIVDALQGQVDGISTSPTFDAIFVDEINEKTAAHGIYLNDETFFWDNVHVATGKAITVNSINAHLASTLTIASGNDLDVSATAALTVSGGTVAITAGVAQSVVVRGGPLYPDLSVNVIGEDTAAAGVTVDGVLLKDGDVTTATATDKVKTNLIEAGAVAGGITTLGISAAGTLALSTSGGADITLTADDDVSITATDDLTLAGGGGTGIGLDGGAQTVLISGPSGVNISGSLGTPSGALTIAPASSVTNVTGAIYSDNTMSIVLPLAVAPNAGFSTTPVFRDYAGTLNATVYYKAAVASTSAAGDVTITIYDGDDTALSAATSVDGTTSTNVTITTQAFNAGFYAAIDSNNADAVQGYGMQVEITFSVSGPAV